MSVETDTSTDEDKEIESVAVTLGEAIQELSTYESFLEAKEAVEADEAVQKEIAKFERVRESYLDARTRGEATRDDLRELQEHQEHLHEMPVMQTYLQAQNDLELRLQELNEYVSSPLDIDFAEKAGGCCQE